MDLSLSTLIDELKIELRKRGAVYFRIDDDFIIFFHNLNTNEDEFLGCYYFPRHEHYEKFLRCVEIYEEVPSPKNFRPIISFIERRFMFTKTSLEKFIDEINYEDKELLLEEWGKNNEKNNDIYINIDFDNH